MDELTHRNVRRYFSERPERHFLYHKVCAVSYAQGQQGRCGYTHPVRGPTVRQGQRALQLRPSRPDCYPGQRGQGPPGSKRHFSEQHHG